jgi:hypothetical protein
MVARSRMDRDRSKPRDVGCEPLSQYAIEWRPNLGIPRVRPACRCDDSAEWKESVWD